ncbi:MAG TPA: hypothetical protein VGE24_09530 [Emticicia sp.]
MNEPANNELRAAYLAEKNKNNELNISWIVEESSAQYIIKIRVGEKEVLGYLMK